MAYVLGFFTADGNMIKNKRGACFIEFYGTDRDIIEKIKILLNSNHKIGVRHMEKINENWKTAYRLQIGSKIIFDGDGHVSASEYQKKDRKNKSRIIISGFTSGSKKFLEGLMRMLNKYKITQGGTLFYSQGYRLCFAVQDSLRLYNFMYKESGTLYLERKKSIFKHYFNNWTGRSIG